MKIIFTESDRFELVFILKKSNQTKPNRTETGRFELVSVFFLNFSLVIFFNKNQTELKITTSNKNNIYLKTMALWYVS
jgi:hypothetical protein